jgi:hypothetical protein
MGYNAINQFSSHCFENLTVVHAIQSLAILKYFNYSVCKGPFFVLLTYCSLCSHIFYRWSFAVVMWEIETGG